MQRFSFETHHTSSPRAVFLCRERRTFLHFIQKPHALLDCFSLCSKRVNFNERGRNGRKYMINKLIHLSFFSLEPRGERQRAAPFCAACGLLDHAQRIPMERILQGGLQNWAWYVKSRLVDAFFGVNVPGCVA